MEKYRNREKTGRRAGYTRHRGWVYWGKSDTEPQWWMRLEGQVPPTVALLDLG